MLVRRPHSDNPFPICSLAKIDCVKNLTSNLPSLADSCYAFAFYSSSVNLSKMLMLKIITRRPGKVSASFSLLMCDISNTSVHGKKTLWVLDSPIVTIIKRAKPNHPRIIAAVPTPDLTLPLPKSCAIVLAATDAVCCHSTDTRTKTLATNINASAI